jgi:predicted DNA-binding transcriptional regulator AlpA
MAQVIYSPARLLRRVAAAEYLSISPSFFDQLVKAGKVPPPRVIAGKVKAWDRKDLDGVADDSPYDGAPAPDAPALDDGPSELDRMLGT